MSIGIYKANQGYWVRVLTATMIAVVTMTTAVWLWQQMGVVASNLPKVRWAMNLSRLEGVPAAGQTVTLLAKPDRTGGEPKAIGTAVVKNFATSSKELIVASPDITEKGADPSLAQRVRSTGAAGGANAFDADISGVPAGSPAIDPILLQGGVGMLAILIGAMIAWYATAMNKPFVEFLIATDMEMRKVNWSTRRDVIMSTFVVIAAAMLLAGALFGVDLTFRAFFKFIGVLV